MSYSTFVIILWCVALCCGNLLREYNIMLGHPLSSVWIEYSGGWALELVFEALELLLKAPEQCLNRNIFTNKEGGHSEQCLNRRIFRSVFQLSIRLYVCLLSVPLPKEGGRGGSTALYILIVLFTDNLYICLSVPLGRGLDI